MEYYKSPGDGSSTRTVRSEKGPRRPNKGRNVERKILANVTGRDNSPFTYRKQDRCLSVFWNTIVCPTCVTVTLQVSN
jgi:hypothetical protein